MQHHPDSWKHENHATEHPRSAATTRCSIPETARIKKCYLYNFLKCSCKHSSFEKNKKIKKFKNVKFLKKCCAALFVCMLIFFENEPSKNHNLAAIINVKSIIIHSSFKMQLQACIAHFKYQTTTFGAVVPCFSKTLLQQFFNEAATNTCSIFEQNCKHAQYFLILKKG